MNLSHAQRELTDRWARPGIGSPPRVWGQPLVSDHKGPPSRFTPTRVGTASSSWHRVLPTSVHPHACGDSMSRTRRRRCPVGSPPRVWGQLHRTEGHGTELRFTPTRVGTARYSTCRRLSTIVHPHACGDSALAGLAFADRHGSPPRVWGQHNDRRHVPRPARFTPTRVGTAGRAPVGSEPTTIHPHACGDSDDDAAWPVLRDGSPPRVWGQQPLLASRRQQDRFTPTRVGTASREPFPSPDGTVHPHACGDSNGRDYIVRRLGGSPPRVWGQRARVR